MTRYKHIPLTLDELKEKLATWDEEELQNIYIHREFYSQALLETKVWGLVELFSYPQDKTSIELLIEEEQNEY